MVPLEVVPPVSELIKNLSEQIESGTLFVVPNRESRVFERNQLVRKLIISLRRETHAQELIEATLDNLFVDLRKGERFDHAELVMAVLFAMKKASVSFYDDIARVFRESGAAELVALRQFAAELG
jgi:hypothetical protein